MPGGGGDRRRSRDLRRQLPRRPIALALDFAKLAIAELGAISERRIALLVDGRSTAACPRSWPGRAVSTPG